MTDTEMRHLWRRLETEGCYIIRYNPTRYADTRHLWRLRITNPTWSVSPTAEHGIGNTGSECITSITTTARGPHWSERPARLLFARVGYPVARPDQAHILLDAPRVRVRRVAASLIVLPQRPYFTHRLELRDP